MPGSKEAFSSTVLTLAEVTLNRAYSNNRYRSGSRTALAVDVALSMAIEESPRRYFNPERLQMISQLVPMIYAANDYFDVGVSAKLRKERGCSDAQLNALVAIESATSKEMRKRRDDFLRMYPGQERTIVDNFVHDGALLSESRFEYSDSLEYEEIDNAIFAVMIYGAVAPDMLREIGIDTNRVCNSVEDLGSKYSFFRMHMNRRVESDAEKAVLGLHAVEMILTAQDDRYGVKEDEILGMHNMYLYAQKVSEGEDSTHEIVFGRYINRYKHLARGYGYSDSVIKASTLLARTHELSVKRERRKSELLDLNRVEEILDIKGANALRERLYESGTLSSAFA